MKRIAILGSTGSIGTQTLEVAEACSIPVMGITGNQNISLLEQQIRRFRPQLACVLEEAAAKSLRTSVADTNTEIVCGVEGLKQVASMEEADTVVTSIVGSAGLLPTLAAIEAGKTIALANKETLVTAGELVTRLAREKNVPILPVDSEHSAIFQCLQCGKKNEVKKLIITASGGSFYNKKREELENVTAEAALKHPNWSMGRKITIDSATLMNKGLEVIEAHWLFDVEYDSIDVLVHRESVIHSMVQFCDNSIIAQLGVADMKLPIHYSLHYPDRTPSITPPVDLAEISCLHFAKPDCETFRALPLAIKAGRMGGTAPAAVNAANEVAVDWFLNGKIKFNQISEILESVLQNHKNIINPSIFDIIETDANIRKEMRLS